jgi:hypothetical protein
MEHMLINHHLSNRKLCFQHFDFSRTCSQLAGDIRPCDFNTRAGSRSPKYCLSSDTGRKLQGSGPAASCLPHEAGGSSGICVQLQTADVKPALQPFPEHLGGDKFLKRLSFNLTRAVIFLS